jgi:hypothetical protein
MFDDQIRLEARMKPAFPFRACVIAYLDGKEVDSASRGWFTPTSGLRKDQIT